MLCSGKFDACDEIFFSVGPQLPDRQLASCEDHGLGQVFKHERQRRRRIGHGVCPVQNDETVVRFISVSNDSHEFGPMFRCHVAGIDRPFELEDIDID